MNLGNFKDKGFELIVDKGPNLLWAILVLIVGLWITKWIIKVAENSFKKRKMDDSLFSFLKSFMNFTLKVLVIVTSAIALGLPMSPFITILGTSGLAIGLALKDSLSNFAGGVIILTSRTFSIGDFIEVEGFSGTVKDINLLYTSLNTTDNKKVTIPNASLANSKLTNFSVEKTRRVDLVFSIDRNENIEKAKEIFRKIVESHELILKEPKPIIRVGELVKDSVNFDIKIWCNNDNYWDVYYDINEVVKVEFDKEKINVVSS